MRHEEGDEEVRVKDCILLASGNKKKDLPFIAKVTGLWEQPEDGKHVYTATLAVPSRRIWRFLYSNSNAGNTDL